MKLLNWKYILPIFFLATLCCTSCNTSLLVQTSGVLKDASSRYILKNGDRSIIYIPMRHLGTRAYYDHIKAQVQSLQQQGYVVFFESIAYTLDQESERDVYDRKFRKLTGNRVGMQKCLETYQDTSRILRAPQYRNLGQRIIGQPDYSFFGVDYASAVKADIPKNVLLDEFEYLYGEVVLDSCDMQTPLNEPYGCKPIKTSLRNKFDKTFIMKRREINLASLVDDASQQKILILFGSAHFKGFLHNLQARDPQWVRVKNNL